MNRGIPIDFFEKSNNACTPELCAQNFKNGIETTVVLDTNIISAIRKFTFKEITLDSRICSIVERLIEIFSKLQHVYISPGLALVECSDTLRDKNIMAFNLFLEQYLPRFTDAYNHLDYKTSSEKEKYY